MCCIFPLRTGMEVCFKTGSLALITLYSIRLSTDVVRQAYIRGIATGVLRGHVPSPKCSPPKKKKSCFMWTKWTKATCALPPPPPPPRINPSYTTEAYVYKSAHFQFNMWILLALNSGSKICAFPNFTIIQLNQIITQSPLHVIMVNIHMYNIYKIIIEFKTDYSTS